MSPRTEKRESIAIPVRASGVDANGNSFRQPACTLDLSSKGARITGVTGLAVGQTLTLEYQNNKIRFEVMWVGKAGTPRAGQAGLRKMDGDKMLADISFDSTEYVDQWKATVKSS